MLTVGTARVGQSTIMVAGTAGSDGLIDGTEALREYGSVRSLDDLLDLPDADMDAAVALLRRTPASLLRSELCLSHPLLRPARARDCGMISIHLEPAFRVMIDRVTALGSPEADEARALLEEMIARGFGGPLRFGERDVDTLSGDGDLITNPGGELDFELELAAVVRRSEKGEPEIFGYTLYNDWTLRDLQIRNFVESRNLHGSAKNFPAANSFGPMVVLAEDFGDPASAVLWAEIDGERITERCFEGIVWSFPDGVRELYREEAISGHELVGSGTLLNGSLFEQRRLLPPGATVRLGCDAIGVLANPTGVSS
jgi:2-keto-4-pentenoate hydratase/2-oxohepta-3-ene-1,7-dioic acid hydratase in catechol pathway